MANEILVTMNKKAFEAPELWEGIRFLQEQAGFVSLVGEEPENLPERIQNARAWVVVGGDGTLNRVVTQLMPLPEKNRVPVCYIPYGTGNDFARTLGLGESSPLATLQQAFSPSAAFVPITVGGCGKEYFVNMATGGLFATVTPETNETFKSLAGRWSYFIHGIGKLLERESIRVGVNGEEPVPALGFFVANARFAGGGVQVLAEADPFDPSLDFLLVPDMPAPDLLALGLELQKEEPNLESFPVQRRKVKRLKLTFDRPVPINLDGEQVQLREAEFSSQAQALSIFLPKSSQV